MIVVYHRAAADQDHDEISGSAKRQRDKCFSPKRGVQRACQQKYHKATALPPGSPRRSGPCLRHRAASDFPAKGGTVKWPAIAISRDGTWRRRGSTAISIRPLAGRAPRCCPISTTTGKSRL